MCVASALRATAVWEEDQTNWTRSLTWWPYPKRCGRQGWMSCPPETLAGRRLSFPMLCFKASQSLEVLLASSSTGTCATLPITARCIMERGEQRSSMFPHLAASPPLTPWFLCCELPYWPCWTSWRTRDRQPHRASLSLIEFYTQLLKIKLEQFIHLNTSTSFFAFHYYQHSLYFTTSSI